MRHRVASAARAAVLVTAFVAMAAGSGCASVRDRVAGLWPFGGEESGERSSDPDRISVLALEQKLELDPALASATIVVPPAQALADWPSGGGVPSNAPQNVEAAGPLEVVWRRGFGSDTGGRRAITAPVIVSGGRIFVLDGSGRLHAVDPASGRQIWSADTLAGAGRTGLLRRRGEAPPSGGGLGAGDGRVYAATGLGDVVAYNAADGSEIWRAGLGAPVHASPLVASGRVFVASNDSELYALAADTGVVQWTQSAIAEPARMLASPGPALVGDTLVAPFASGEIMALVAANGRRLWGEALTRAGTLTSLSTINDIAGRPAVAGGVVYAGSQSGVFAAIDLRTGTRLWDKPIASIQMPWVAGDYVFVVSTSAELVAMDRRTGGVKWTRQLPRWERESARKGLISWTGPVMAGGRLVLASSHGEALILRPEDGEVLATRQLGGGVQVAAAVAGGTVYFYTQDAQLVALR